MPQKVLKFTGINRKKNEFQNAGACEELINVRPAVYGLEVVKPKSKKFAEANYDVYNHVFGDKSIFIGVSTGNPFSLSIIDKNGGLSNIDSFASNIADYSISFLANKMMVSHSNSLYVYEYKDNGYVKIDSGVPDDFNVKLSVKPHYKYSGSLTSATNDAIVNSWSALQQKNDAILGPVLVAFNFSLNDETEFWTNKWIYVNPFHFNPDFDNNIHSVYYYDSNGDLMSMFGCYDVNITIPQQQFVSEGETLVDKLNIYMSRPVYPYKDDYRLVEEDETQMGTSEYYGATMKSFEEMEMGEQLLYFYKSIPISEIQSGDVKIALNVPKALEGEKVLEVDSGTIKRVGKITSYNNRAHFYDSNSVIYPQQMFCLSHSDEAGQLSSTDAYVYLDCDSQTVVLKTRVTIYKKITEDYPSKVYCCYPDARATKILIFMGKVSARTYCVVNLKQSNRYNFAYGEANCLEDITNIGEIKTTSRLLPETDKINVSAPYNPFVFPVENSYSVGGKIVDLATSYIPISSTQIGQYPLTVFTTNGIYSLEHGSGKALYSNVLPIQPLVATTKATPTPYGIFFISSRNLYMLSGRDVANASYVMNGDRELNLREDNAYKKLCLNSDDARFNFSKYLSDVNFEDFISNATLTYDELQNELIISSNDESIGYSYVFNLDTKAYHKVSKRYISKDKNARYVIEQDGNYKYVVDLHTEQTNEQSILLQSRPFGVEMAYTHIERLLMLVDTKLTGEQNLCISVFGSDNLSDWKCIISSQKHDTVLRHIRTNRAAKSYKDYVILINGKVDTNTDLSELAIDYTVVNRRLA